MNLYETAMQELSVARRQAEEAAEERKKAAMSWQGFAERYGRIRRIRVEMGKCMAQGGDLSALTEERERLSAELNAICAEHGASPQELLPRYSCTRCNDSGFVGGEPCFCLKQRVNELVMEGCGLPAQKYPRFADADFSVFSEEIRAQRHSLYAKCARYCAEYPDVVFRNLVFLGPTGTGKTYLLRCMAEALIARGYTVLFASAFSLNQAFFRYMNYRDADRRIYLDRLCGADFLLIDDLGSENRVENVTGEYLLNVLNQRMEEGKSVLLTTNLDLDRIKDRYGERIFSRLFASKESHIVSMDGADLRVKLR